MTQTTSFPIKTKTAGNLLEVPFSEPTLEVVSKTSVTDEIIELILAHPVGERLPDWTPGSHIDLVLPTGETRQYSLCGDRWDAYNYRVAIRRESNGRGGSSYIHSEIEEGSFLTIGGPRNNFRLVPAEKYIFVAGGIGITAILPMIYAAEKLGVPWTLHYLGRSRKTMPFLDELGQFKDAVQIWPKDEHGPLNLCNLLSEVKEDVKVYSCGPVRMLDELEELSAQWPEGALRLEHFTAKEQGEPARKEAFEIKLLQSDQTLTVEPGVSVLDTMQNADVSILSSCRTGTCGTCEVRVVEGSLDHRDSILTPAERASGHTMFPCVSRSLGPHLVLDI